MSNLARKEPLVTHTHSKGPLVAALAALKDEAKSKPAKVDKEMRLPDGTISKWLSEGQADRFPRDFKVVWQIVKHWTAETSRPAPDREHWHSLFDEQQKFRPVGTPGPSPKDRATPPGVGEELHPRIRRNLVVGTLLLATVGAVAGVFWAGAREGDGPATSLPRGGPGTSPSATSPAPTSPAAPFSGKPLLTLTSPSPGARVPRLVKIEGAAALLPGRQLWFVLKGPQDPLFHVTTREPVPVSPDGTFSTYAGLGRGACDIGTSQTLYAVHTAIDGALPTRAALAAKENKYLHLQALPSDAELAAEPVVITLDSFTGAPDRCPATTPS